MRFSERFVSGLTVNAVLAVFLLCQMPTFVGASPGTDVFQAFLQHISVQIGKDKQDFAQADVCTAWFYKKMGKKPTPPARVEKIHFVPITEQDPSEDCAKRFPNGLDSVREAFESTQKHLSFSLTFFQLALISDGDDNHAYSIEEMQDMLDAFDRTYQGGQSVDQYVGQLIALFERSRPEIQFPVLMAGMQTLMDKGYRFTKADQIALDRELN